MLILPFMVLFLTMIVVPLIYSGYLSFFKTKLIGGTSFVGAENYLRALTDPSFLSGVGRMGLFLLVQVPLMLVLSLFSALALDSGMMRLAKFARLAIFVPYAVPSVIATLMWGYIYGPDFGPIAQIGEASGSGPAVLQRNRHLLLDHQHRELGVRRLQHDHHVRRAPLDPGRAVRGGPGRRCLGDPDRDGHQDPVDPAGDPAHRHLLGDRDVPAVQRTAPDAHPRPDGDRDRLDAQPGTPTTSPSSTRTPTTPPPWRSCSASRS